MHELHIPVKKLHSEAKLPTKAHFTDAGWDLYAVGKYTIRPGVITKVKTGIAIEIPKGYVGLIWDRSGKAIKNGLHRVAGVIDASYRGELIVGITCVADKNWCGYDRQYGHAINTGDRIAQLLIQEIPLHVTFEEVEELSVTERGKGGFGSTGN